jgi:hypothetical protein
MTTSVPSGLRERKKAKTRAGIREHAMRVGGVPSPDGRRNR